MSQIAEPNVHNLPKAPTGIDGFDEITDGGLPQGRPTLVCGSAGCGKTLFSIEFLVRGAIEFGEPGVFVTFEENPDDIIKNVASLGFDLKDLEARNLLRIDHIHLDRSEIEVAGDFDLEGLFLRLQWVIDSIGAKRIVLDTIETIFSTFDNAAILRSEVRRLFYWLKEKGMTAVITGERGDGNLTRQGLEEYVSDCVILLDQKIFDQVSTRRIRIVKYRGSTHGTNEYPFLIDRDGFSVLPVTALGLLHGVSKQRISSGVPSLDEMLGGQGYYRASSVLIGGTAGTGKSSLAAHFANQTCRDGQKCIYFAFEESQEQIVRNMASIGLDLQPWLDSGLLVIHATRPMHYGLEMHLATMQRMIKKFGPAAVIIDPISNMSSVGSEHDINSMLIRLVDFLKAKGITGLFVNLTSGGTAAERTDLGMSSLMDTWILVRDIELNGERNRGIYVLKSRGMKHSNQIREFQISAEGINLRPAYLGREGVLTGSARVAQEQQELAAIALANEEIERRRSLFERKKKALEAQMAALQTEMESESAEMERFEHSEVGRLARDDASRQLLMASRRVEAEQGGTSNGG